jgi:hypothetical protein
MLKQRLDADYVLWSSWDQVQERFNRVMEEAREEMRVLKE